MGIITCVGGLGKEKRFQEALSRRAFFPTTMVRATTPPGSGKQLTAVGGWVVECCVSVGSFPRLRSAPLSGQQTPRRRP